MFKILENVMTAAIFITSILILCFTFTQSKIPGEILPPPDQQTTLHDDYLIEMVYKNFTFNIIGPQDCREKLDDRIENFFQKPVSEFKNLQPENLSEIRGIVGYIRIFYETCYNDRTDFVINTWYDVPAVTSRSYLGIIRSLDSLYQMQFRLGERLFMNQTIVKMNNLEMDSNFENFKSRQFSKRL